VKPFLCKGLSDLFADAFVCSSDQEDLGGRCTCRMSISLCAVPDYARAAGKGAENMAFDDSLEAAIHTHPWSGELLR